MKSEKQIRNELKRFEQISSDIWNDDEPFKLDRIEIVLLDQILLLR